MSNSTASRSALVGMMASSEHHYYSRLAEHIKDVMGQQGKPATLKAMKTLAHSIDSCYWEQNREKSRSGKNKSDNQDKPDNKNQKPDDKNKASTSGTSGGNHNNPKGNKNNKSGKPASSSGNSTSISDKLGKDGKLTPQERQWRFNNNLCLFCGGTGHTARECPKSSSSASKAKAHAAQVKEKEKESPDS